MFSRIAVTVLMAVLVAGRPQPAPYLEGRVIDGETGQPIAGAAVRLSGRRSITLETDREGRYQSDTLPPGMYSMTVTSDGYLPAIARYAGRVTLLLRIRDAGIGPPVIRKDWMLERAAVIAGRILRDDGAPAEAVTVIAAKRARSVEGWPELEIKSSARTNASGRFRITGLARGPYVLAYQLAVAGSNRWFYSPGIADPRHMSQVEAAPEPGAEPIALRASSAPFPDIPIATVSASGAPVANAAVELTAWTPFPETGARATVSAVTDASGRGILSGVPAGRHQIRARAPASLSSAATARASTFVQVPDNPGRTFEIRLRSTVQACVFTRAESDGARPSDTVSPPRIRAWTRDGALGDESLETQAPLGGTLSLRGLLPGSLLRLDSLDQALLWTLTRFSPAVPAPGGALPVDAAAAGCAAAYFRRTTESIRGRVRLEDLEWVPEIEVTAMPIGAPAAPVVVSAMTDDGTFHLNGIAIGIRYEIAAVPAGFSIDMIPPPLRHVIKAAGGDVITIPLSLPIAR